MTGPGSRSVNPAAARPPRPVPVPQPDEEPQNKQQKSKVPVLEKNLISQLSSGEQDSINSKFQEATEADKKAPVLSLAFSLLFLLHHIFDLFTFGWLSLIICPLSLLSSFFILIKNFLYYYQFASFGTIFGQLLVFCLCLFVLILQFAQNLSFSVEIFVFYRVRAYMIVDSILSLVEHMNFLSFYYLC